MQLGFHTVLVLSGGTRHESLRDYAYEPELVVSSIADLHRILGDCGWQPWWLAKPAVRRRSAAPAAA